MTTTVRVAAALLVLVLSPSLARAQEGSGGAPPAGEAAASTCAAPAMTAAGGSPAAEVPAAPAQTGDGSLSASIDRAITRVLRAHEDPCAKADSEGKPCFPVVVEEAGPSFSVREGLRHYRPDGQATPGVPTNAEIQKQMSGAPQSASGGVGTDPVCAAKSLIRLFKGQSNTFYLYRLTKEGVERPLLTDRKLDLSTYAVAPGAVLEFIGPFSGQCEAIAAWRKGLRNGREAPPSPDTEIEYRPGSRP